MRFKSGPAGCGTTRYRFKRPSQSRARQRRQARSQDVHKGVAPAGLPFFSILPEVKSGRTPTPARSPCRSAGCVLRCQLFAGVDDHDAERCESGRIGVPGEHESWQRDRGFESHPLRHSWRDRSRRFVDQMAMARQLYRRAMGLPVHDEVSPGDGQSFTERGWDSNEGDRGGEAPPRGEHTRGLAPSVGARGALVERDFECPPSPPNRACSTARPYNGGRADKCRKRFPWP